MERRRGCDADIPWRRRRRVGTTELEEAKTVLARPPPRNIQPRRDPARPRRKEAGRDRRGSTSSAPSGRIRGRGVAATSRTLRVAAATRFRLHLARYGAEPPLGRRAVTSPEQSTSMAFQSPRSSSSVTSSSLRFRPGSRMRATPSSSSKPNRPDLRPTRPQPYEHRCCSFLQRWTACVVLLKYIAKSGPTGKLSTRPTVLVRIEVRKDLEPVAANHGELVDRRVVQDLAERSEFGVVVFRPVVQ